MLRLERSGSPKARRSYIALVGTCSAALVFSACGNATVNRSTKDGVVEGRLLINPPMGSNIPTNGTVTYHKLGSRHSSVTFNVSNSGRFTLDLPPGTWVVTGGSPLYGDSHYVCVTNRPVVVSANHRLSVSVECIEK